MNRFGLALRLLWRDGRSGELTILLCALIIAVSCSTAITLFADRLQRTMTQQAAEFLAADLVISSSSALPLTWQQQASRLQLQQAQAVEFPSVLIEHDEMLLSSVKAVTARYPLRGYLKITDNDKSEEKITHQPPPVGETWVERRVLSALKLKLGDYVTVGEKPLKISQILLYEPDKQGDFYTMSPRALINQADLAATQVMQPGSRVRYLFQFSGNEQALKQFKTWLKPQLNPAQRLIDIHDDSRELGDALTRAERYLGLSSIVVVLIAGVAIAMTTRRYSERHFNTAAILRCLGCTQRQILALFSGQFLVLGIIGSGLGCIIGWLAQQGLFYLLRSLLPTQLASPTLLATFFGFLTGLAILFGFALPPLLRLKKVSALRVLRRDLEPLPISAWLVYGLAFSLTATLIGFYTQDLKMSAIVIGGCALLLILSGGLVYLSLWQVRKFLPKLNLSWRFGLQALVRNPQTSISQILAFSLTLVAMIISFTVRTDLLNDWQRQLPANAPNHFALNIFPQQLTTFAQDLKQHQIQGSEIYPVISGRLTAINNVVVQQIVSKETQGERAIRRDLSLTWSAALPTDNKIVAGSWWNIKPPKGLVSIEEKLAKSLKVNVGDVLTFTIANQSVNATVSSIRSLHWDSMKPNFYMIFSPTTLDNYPSTYLTSFYLATNQKNLLNQIIKTYPNITVLEVDLIVAQLKTILAQLTAAINYVLYFALLAGFTVLFAAVTASLDQRIYEGALMRTLGANRRLLRKTHLLEFSLLGFISSSLAVLISQLLVFALYHWLLDLEYAPNWRVCGIVPVIGTLFVTLAGYWGVKDVANQSPMITFRQQ
jgi:putative ABC transport system permease protein